MKITIKKLILCVVFFCSFFQVHGFSNAPAEEELRIVSLSPSITEILYVLGVGKNVVGNTLYCDFPEDAKYKNKVGDFLNFDIEKVLKVKPNLIFTTEGNNLFKIQQLKQLNFKIIFIEPPRSLKLYEGMIEKIARSVHKENEGRLLIFKMNKALQNLQKIINKNKGKNILILLQLEPLYAVAQNSWLGDLFKSAGFQNIFKESFSGYGVFSQEILFTKKPEIVFVDHLVYLNKKETYTILKRIFKSSTDKIKFIQLPKDIFVRFGPRIIDAFKFLKELDD
ncbi:MAG: helical backbone metal receptor [Silvanigrellaceae bacterium]|nr:helical backbone metal receptor [Silvanigrellaceae bacterium]